MRMERMKAQLFILQQILPASLTRHSFSSGIGMWSFCCGCCYYWLRQTSLPAPYPFCSHLAIHFCRLNKVEWIKSLQRRRWRWWKICSEKNRLRRTWAAVDDDDTKKEEIRGTRSFDSSWERNMAQLKRLACSGMQMQLNCQIAYSRVFAFIFILLQVLVLSFPQKENLFPCPLWWIHYLTPLSPAASQTEIPHESLISSSCVPKTFFNDFPPSGTW